MFCSARRFTSRSSIKRRTGGSPGTLLPAGRGDSAATPPLVPSCKAGARRNVHGMAELLEGHLAPTGGDQQAAPAPFRLRDSGRVGARPGPRGRRPLPPLLWGRLDDEQRAGARARRRDLRRGGRQGARARRQGTVPRRPTTRQALREAVGVGQQTAEAESAGARSRGRRGDARRSE